MTAPKLSLIAVGISSILSTTCCPSLWLTVTKDDPAPRASVPQPKIEPTIIPMPPHIDNRFDLFMKNKDGVAGVPTTAYPGYRDDFPPGSCTGPAYRDADTLSEYQCQEESLSDLLGIQEQFGNLQETTPVLDELEGLDETQKAIPAEFSDCSDGIPCTTLVIKEPLTVAQPRVARLLLAQPKTSFIRMIQACEPLNAKGRLPAGCRQPTSGGTYMTLARGIPARTGDRVRLLLYEKPRLSEPLLTFFHLSDVQIRDPNVRIGNRSLSRQLDWLIQSFEYDADQELYQKYVAESLFQTINQEVRERQGPAAELENKIADLEKSPANEHSREPAQRKRELADLRALVPTLVIHTGDAIDSGVTSELRQVHRLVDRLQIPLFNGIGNHDVLTFGNLIPTSKPTDDSSCATVDSIAKNRINLSAFWARLLVPNRLCVNPSVFCPNCFQNEVARVAELDPNGYQKRFENEVELVAGPDINQSRKNFINGFKHEEFAILPQLRPADSDDWTRPNNKPLTPGLPNPKLQPVTRQHGFDLNPQLGYYAFAKGVSTGGEKKGRHVVFIVLNTDDLATDNQGGTPGRVGSEQMKWLENILDWVASEHSKDLVFVFGHHEMSDIATEIARDSNGKDGKTLEETLVEHKNVVAYFYGHEHQHGICRDHRNGRRPCRDFWEIETASLIEFPQEGRLVRLKYVGAGLAFLEVTVFKENLAVRDDALAKAVELGRRGAERDLCRTNQANCSDDLRVYRNDGRHTNARLFFRLPEFRPDHP